MGSDPLPHGGRQPLAARLPALWQMWEWRLLARCRGLPTEIFFPDHDKGARRIERERYASDFCQLCPVLQRCRSYAIDATEPYGIWGATTPSERHRLKRVNGLGIFTTRPQRAQSAIESGDWGSTLISGPNASARSHANECPTEGRPC